MRLTHRTNKGTCFFRGNWRIPALRTFKMPKVRNNYAARGKKEETLKNGKEVEETNLSVLVEWYRYLPEPIGN